MNTARDILIYLSFKYLGDWNKMYQAMQDREQVFDDEDLIKRISLMKCKALTILDERYPEYLKNINKPPFVLFYYGDITLLEDYVKVLAVIGSRDCSAYGEIMTKTIVEEVAKKFTIISGLARGVDSFAHESAINGGGKTIAVLGSGIDYCYPFENIELYQKIKNDHLLISEYPEKCEPKSEHFPIRNRLIAVMSKAVLVPEAKERSGSIITVRHAIENNRDVMCVPHEATKKSACNQLIRDGAFLVESAEDVLYLIDN